MRIELFGDEIDTVRYFDPATQRTVEGDVTRVIVPPAREALPGAAAEYAVVWGDDELPARGDLPSWQDDLADLRAGHAFPNLEYYLPLIYPRPASLLDYLPQEALLVVDDWPELETAVAELLEHADQIANEQTDLPPDFPSPLLDWAQMRDELRLVGSRWCWAKARRELEPAAEAPELADAFEPGPAMGGRYGR